MSQDATLLIGRSRRLERVPESPWRQQVVQSPAHMRSRLAFMTTAHHNIRKSAVVLLPSARRALSPARLGQSAGIPEMDVNELLGDLQRELFFLVRDRRGNVSWAFPVTVDRTPHRVTFDTGERLWAA